MPERIVADGDRRDDRVRSRVSITDDVLVVAIGHVDEVAGELHRDARGAVADGDRSLTTVF